MCATPVPTDSPEYLSCLLREREKEFYRLSFGNPHVCATTPGGATLRFPCQIKSRGLLVDQLVNCDTYAIAVAACAVCFVRPVMRVLALGPDDRTDPRLDFARSQRLKTLGRC